MKKIEKLKLTGKLSLNKETVTVFYVDAFTAAPPTKGTFTPPKTGRCPSYWRCCAQVSSTSFPTIGGSHNTTCPD